MLHLSRRTPSSGYDRRYCIIAATGQRSWRGTCKATHRPSVKTGWNPFDLAKVVNGVLYVLLMLGPGTGGGLDGPLWPFCSTPMPRRNTVFVCRDPRGRSENTK